MGALFNKDEDLQASPAIIGYKILKYMKSKKTDKLSIFDITDKFKNEKWFGMRNLYFAIIFLYSIGIIEFEQAYIIKT